MKRLRLSCHINFSGMNNNNSRFYDDIKVSVIVPCYNSSKTILTTLQSICNQTYQNLEVIIIDDGSNDNSSEIVLEFIRKENRKNIFLIRQPNGGVSKARNEGMKRARGKYIALLDSDDEWLPLKLEKQLEIFKRDKTVDLLGTNRNNESFGMGETQNLIFLSPKMLLIKMFLITPTVMFKSSILKEIGFFDEKMNYGEDSNFFLRIASKKRCFLLNESLVLTGGGKMSFGESGLSSNLWGMQKGEFENILFALKNDIISIIEFPFFIVYSFLKYLRRLSIVFLKRFF